MKTVWILLAVLALAGLVLVGVHSEGPTVASTPSATSAPGSETLRTDPAPTFEVHVIRPRMALPLGGLVPARLFGVQPLKFDDTSPGARVGSAAPGHLSLLADGWDLLIEADAQGRIDPGTRLVFSLHLAERGQTLCCRPDEPEVGVLRTTRQADGHTLRGDFVVELATCENTETGKVINWPPRPLTVQGSFARLPLARG